VKSIFVNIAITKHTPYLNLKKYTKQFSYIMDAATNILIIPAEDNRWDEFIEQHPDGWVYHLSAWHRVLFKAFRHIKGQCLAIINTSDGQIIAGLPLFTVSSWLTGKRMVSAPFSTLITPLISNDNQIRPLLSYAHTLSSRNRCSRLEIRSMNSYSGLLPAGFREMSHFKHHAIDLSQPLDVIHKKLDRSCIRQRISRAEANCLEIKKGDSDSDMREFYNLYLITRRRVGRPPQPYKFFKAIWDELHPPGLCELVFARKDGKPLAGLILLKYKKRVSAEWAASDDTFKQISPNQFLFWAAIKDAKQNGFEVFDFGRTSISNKGLMDFKNRWGTAASDMFEIVFPEEKLTKKESDESSFVKKTISKVCRTAPDFLQEPLGILIYRHLG
jgi:hypothetical protein